MEKTGMDQTISRNLVNIEQCNKPKDFIDLIFPYCKTISQRWAGKINELLENDLTVPFKTIKKGIIADIFSLNDVEHIKQTVDLEFGTDLSASEKTVYEQYFENKNLSEFSVNSFSLARLGNKSFSVNTINNWKAGSTSPQDREVVLKLAFWAKYDIQETNKLLECAGMHKLYIKGTGNSKNTKSSLRDLVYMYMIQHQRYSFAEAQELISYLDQQLYESLGKSLSCNNLSSSTKYWEDWLFHKSYGDIDDLKKEFKNGFGSLIHDYRALYGEISTEFTLKYDVEKGPEKYYGEDIADDGGPSSIRALTTSKLNESLKKNKKPVQADRRWRDSLKNTLYAAYNPQKPNINFRIIDPNDPKGQKKKIAVGHLERCFQRNDIIVLGLILNKSCTGINNLLDMCKEPPLYGKNYTESIIINALERNRAKNIAYTDIVDDLYDADLIEYYKVTPDEVKSQFSIYDDIYIEYQNRRNYDKEQKAEAENYYICNAPAINALVSLKTFHWIKNMYLELKPYIQFDKKEQISLIDWFPEKALFEYLISCAAADIKGEYIV
ncbi:MAG: hypothetical protein E7F06_01490 [Lachnospiraceae bacterium]|nr:hypothetical protein [Lachnospiraceae bacterium]